MRVSQLRRLSRTRGMRATRVGAATVHRARQRTPQRSWSRVPRPQGLCVCGHKEAHLSPNKAAWRRDACAHGAGGEGQSGSHYSGSQRCVRVAGRVPCPRDRRGGASPRQSLGGSERRQAAASEACPTKASAGRKPASRDRPLTDTDTDTDWPLTDEGALGVEYAADHRQDVAQRRRRRRVLRADRAGRSVGDQGGGGRAGAGSRRGERPALAAARAPARRTHMLSAACAQACAC